MEWQASGTLTKTTASAIAAKNADRGTRYADMVAEIERVAERRMDTLNASARLSARRTCIEVTLLLGSVVIGQADACIWVGRNSSCS